MNYKTIHKILTFLIAAVWLANGLLCKLLNLVPRHQQIVARILGNDYTSLITKMIGLAEIAMAVWVLSRIAVRLNSVAQIIIIATMNVMEYCLAPDLLLWGKLNIVFAFLFIFVIGYNGFVAHKRSTPI